MPRPRNSPENAEYFLTNAAIFDKPFAFQLAFVLESGCSVRESCDLTLDDVHPSKSIIYLGKKSIPLTPALKRILERNGFEFSPFVFRYRNKGMVSRKFRVVKVNLGWFNISLRDLRK